MERTRIPGVVLDHPPLAAGLKVGIGSASHGSTIAMCRLGSRLGGWYLEGDQARSDLVRTISTLAWPKRAQGPARG